MRQQHKILRRKGVTGNVKKRCISETFRLERRIENGKFGRKIVFCKDNVQVEDDIEYLPWYMIMFYQVQKPESFVYEVDLSAL